MTSADTQSPRERYRAQVCDEIKTAAWEQLAVSGVTALSLNAIAKRLGLSGPALYRYYGSRDDLITDLIRDAYRSLASAFATAAAREPGVDGLAGAMRRWALEDPQRYLLIYGTPIPGYHAPDDITATASSIMSIIIGAHASLPADDTAPELNEHLDNHRDWAPEHTTPSTLRHALCFWTRLHGVLSLELSGHFAGMEFDPALLFDAERDGLQTPGRG